MTLKQYFFMSRLEYRHLRCLFNVKKIIKTESHSYCSEPNTAVKKSRGIPKEMQTFFKSDRQMLEILPHVPSKYLRQNSLSQHFYLTSPKIAKDIVKKIKPFLDLSGKQLIAETNAGLGLITIELLKEGVNNVRMYESCSEFRTELRVSLDMSIGNGVKSCNVFRILAKFIPIE